MSAQQYKVTCVASRVTIADLGLNLVKGQSRNIPRQRMLNSADLKAKRTQGVVTVQPVHRSRQVRQKPTHVQEPLRPEPPSNTGTSTQDRMDSLKEMERLRMIRALVQEELEEALAPVHEKLASIVSGIECLENRPPVTQYVPSPAKGQSAREVMEKVRVAAPSGIDDSDPIFIPSRVMGDEPVSQSIRVQTEDSDSNIDEAGEALKRLRNKNKD